MLRQFRMSICTAGILILMAGLIGPAFAGNKSDSETDQLMKELDKLETLFNKDTSENGSTLQIMTRF